MLNERTKLIGIAGRAGAGKDVVASALIASEGFKKVSFADAIKDGCAVMFGVDRALFDDRERKEQVIDWIGKSPRQLAQLAGTEFGRGLVRDDIWLLTALRKMDPAFSCVISDVRFENEADFIRKNGGVMLHVRRPGTEAGTTSAHSSESGVKIQQGDFCVENDCATAQEFAEKAMAVLGNVV